MKFTLIEKRGGKRARSGAANNPGAAKLFKSSLKMTGLPPGEDIALKDIVRRLKTDFSEAPK